MHQYVAFGLHIASDRALPELRAASFDVPDVTIRSGSISENYEVSENYEDGTADHPPFYEARPDRVILHWPEVGAFRVEGGTEVVVACPDDVDEQLMRLPLLGRVMGALLQQRHQYVLHASSVRVAGHAVAFVGAKGAGKSTTSACLHRHGYPIVTDDVLSVDVHARPIQAVPSFPRLKLWPDAAEAALGDDPATLPPLHERVQKRGRTAEGPFSETALPLAGIYVLAPGADLTVRPRRGTQALMQIVPHAYNRALVEAIDDPAVRRWHFNAAATLCRHVPVRVLRRPPDLTRLDDLATQVVDDVAQLVG